MPTTPSSKKTVLVVDDDRFYGNICKVKLTKEGYNVIVMTNGSWALKTLSEKKVDLMLLDLVMPEMDGFETLKALKSDEKYKNIPVIVLSNLGQPEDLKKAIQLGADDYMIKTIIPIQKMVEKVRSRIAP